jgi:hypothetical protein
MIPDDLVERVARAMCEEMGLDPDAQYLVDSGADRFEWHAFLHDARKAIVFQRAWERVKE